MRALKKKKAIVIPRKYVLAVNNGVKWLDLTFGRKEWLKSMDMTHFQIESGRVCVAGNIFKDQFFKNDDDGNDGYERFEELMRSCGADKTGTKFGFYWDNSTSRSAELGKQYLQDLWVRKINRLKKAKSKKK